MLISFQVYFNATSMKGCKELMEFLNAFKQLETYDFFFLNFSYRYRNYVMFIMLCLRNVITLHTVLDATLFSSCRRLKTDEGVKASKVLQAQWDNEKTFAIIVDKENSLPITSYSFMPIVTAYEQKVYVWF